jgi:hypothetical protein
MLKSLAVVVSLLFAAQANAASITLAWNANQEPQVTGYVVLVGTASGRTEQEFNVGLQTSWTFGSAAAGTTYFFRVQAYTAQGVRSVPSNEVSGRVGGAPTAVPPFGSFDTPANNTQGVTASLAVTGWALDDGGVTRVRILRAPVAGESPGSLVYIGDASLVPGARPDIVATYPSFVQNDRAGWGYLMLTNFLPNLGNGTFTLYAYADDADGHSTLLGTKTITCDNASAHLPFGAIDTPLQGETVSGLVTNFGWVLAPKGKHADPPGGGTVRVVIDGVPVGSPAGWTARADLTSLFTGGQYPGISMALGVFTFDSRTLSDGLHTIAWAVTDASNESDGVGSRYFTVANGTAMTAASVTASAVQAWSTQPSALLGRRGFDMNAPFHSYSPNANGFVTVQSEELDRIELQTGATTAALLTTEGRQPLPIGAGIDADGLFTWQPVAGFVGAYDFVFGGAAGERYVRVVLNPKGSGRVGPQIVIDTPSSGSRLAPDRPFTVAGWAADLDDDLGTGVDAVHVWAYPVGGGDPIFVGLAALGGNRPDVAAVYGRRFTKTGYGVTGTGLPAGDYDLAVFVWSTARQGFVPAKTVRVTVR